ncbi:MAG: hypothetical protein ACK4WH_13110 [Phycisphaerales bacterium]
MIVRIKPKEPDGSLAIRWLPDGSNWREVLTFMGCPLEEEQGDPACLCDQQGNDFGPGDWYVKETGLALSDASFHEKYAIIEDAP